MSIIHFMYAPHLSEGIPLHALIPPLWQHSTSWFINTPVLNAHFMAWIHLTLIQLGYFMQTPYFYVVIPLHVSWLLLWQAYTSCETGTSVSLPHFMIEHDLCGCRTLHADSPLLCVSSTSCIAFTLMNAYHFMYYAHLCGGSTLHGLIWPLW